MSTTPTDTVLVHDDGETLDPAEHGLLVLMFAVNVPLQGDAFEAAVLREQAGMAPHTETPLTAYVVHGETEDETLHLLGWADGAAIGDGAALAVGLDYLQGEDASLLAAMADANGWPAPEVWVVATPATREARAPDAEVWQRALNRAADEIENKALTNKGNNQDLWRLGGKVEGLRMAARLLAGG